jgi:hypothetical protein
VATRVRIVTEEATAIVLIYPRDSDPVPEVPFTEIAQLPPHCAQEFALPPGFDLLVTEMPLAAAAGAESAPAPVAEQKAA